MVIVPLAIATTALPNGVTGTPYSTPIQATGGVAPFTWTIVKGTPPHGLMLSSSDTETVNLAGNPDTVSQSVAFTIQIADSAQNTAIQVYTISIVSQASTLQLSPPSLDFGNELVGSTSGVLTETLTNTATPAVSITAIAIQPGSTDFSVVSNTCPSLLPSLASCVIGVTFKPTQSGPQSTILNITDDTEASPQEVVLGGIGLTSGPNATVYPAIVYLGIQLVGTTSPSRPITVTNYGAATLNVSSITASSNFDETDDCVGSVPSLGSCTIHVGFAPGTEGVLDGSVTIADDAPGSPQTVALTGTGSTTTPLLTGYCAYATSLCGVREAVDSGQCPQGVRSDHPWSIAVCPVGPARGQGFPVDGQRPCQTATGQGFCATQPP